MNITPDVGFVEVIEQGGLSREFEYHFLKLVSWIISIDTERRHAEIYKQVAGDYMAQELEKVLRKNRGKVVDDIAQQFRYIFHLITDAYPDIPEYNWETGECPNFWSSRGFSS